MNATLFDIAKRHVGIREIPGEGSHPLIVWWLRLGSGGATLPDEIPWCSGFVNGMCWLLDLPRSNSLAARSWLTVGTKVDLSSAQRGDVVILKRGGGIQPGPEVLNATGHVGFLDHFDGTFIWILGGNQSNAVTISPFVVTNVLGVRRVT